MSGKHHNLQISANDLHQQLNQLIAERQSFEVWDVTMDNMQEVVELLETTIESTRLTCRIYTKGRWMAAAAGLVYPPAAAAVLTGIAIHNVTTYNPDYEICRDLANGRLIIQYDK